ncbi:MAG: tRNA (adenosine(37)-N6)-threonylcarbamoyltransferase complex dimerization subunit type 1 TsaB [Candidatus Omnitrophota bacterium]
MNILSLETSTKNFSIAVLKDQKIIFERNMKLKDVLSSSILPAIIQVLTKSKMSLARLDGFAVGLGPGSFTSLRVGLSTVKGLAFATKKPIAGISSLDILAMNVPEKYTQQICTLCDAKRNLFYCCFYEKQNGLLKRKTDYLLLDRESIQQKINKRTVLLGDGVKIWQEEPEAGDRDNFQYLDEKYWHPKASHLAYLAAERFKKKKYDLASKIVPIYLYADDCQVQK